MLGVDDLEVNRRSVGQGNDAGAADAEQGLMHPWALSDLFTRFSLAGAA
jgi:hypothetical protein